MIKYLVKELGSPQFNWPQQSMLCLQGTDQKEGFKSSSIIYIVQGSLACKLHRKSAHSLPGQQPRRHQACSQVAPSQN